MYKLLFVLILQITVFPAIKANDISLYSGDVQFVIPDDYVEKVVPKESSIGYYSESGEKAIALLTYRNSNFSASKVFEKMDSVICDLSKYELIYSEKEGFWNATKDYVTKKYISSDGRKFASHIRYVTEGAYCFGFWYNNDEEYREFEELIDSIHFKEEDSWGQIGLVLKYNVWFIILLVIMFFAASAFAGGSGEQDFASSIIASLIITFVIALIILIPLWHFWVAYATVLGIYFVTCFLCSFFGFYLVPGED